MINKHQNTDEILSAIREMMKEEEIINEQPLPKDVLELTESPDPKKDSINQDVLELTDLIDDNDQISSLANNNKKTSLEIEEDSLRELVRESIKNHSSEKLDLIIKQEIKNIIKEKLSKAQVVIDSGDRD